VSSVLASSTLVDLLGPARAGVVERLRVAPASVAELASDLELSEGATRRHLASLDRDGLVATETVRRPGPGRPSTRYALSEKARRLYPDRSADLANEVLDYLQAQHGRPALLEFLRWRQGRQAERYSQALGGVTNPRERVARLAELLSADGFLAEAATVDGATTELRQGHCAIADVAAAHPALCAHEAALFARLLDGRLSRRQTIAGGAPVCVATITHAQEQ